MTARQGEHTENLSQCHCSLFQVKENPFTGKKPTRLRILLTFSNQSCRGDSITKYLGFFQSKRQGEQLM